MAMNRADGKSRLDQLDWAAENFARTSPSSHPAPAAQPGQTSLQTTPTSPRRLNPIFTEWLMGWPLQWTKAEPSASNAAETAWWRCKLQQHLCSFFGERKE